MSPLPPLPTPNPSDSSGAPSRPFSILLIEDNPIDAKIITAMINKSTDVLFSVDHVSSLEAAERRLSTNIYDVILSDLTLPDSSGVETLERLLTKAPHIPVVALTGVEDETVAMTALERGAQDYLTKGKIDTNSLVRAVRFAIRRMRASEDFWSRFNDILQNDEDLTMVVDKEGTLLTLTNAIPRLLGFPVSVSLVGRSLRDLVLQPVQASFPPQVATIPPEGLHFQSIPFARQDGGQIALDIHVSTTAWQSGTALHMVLRDPKRRQTAEDKMMNLLHQLNENQEQLRKLDNMKDDFLSTVSHELRTPLTSITGYLKLLTNKTAGPLNNMQEEFATTALRNAERLALLVNNLLDLSRLESGRSKLFLATVPVDKLLDDSLITIHNLAEQKKITLLREPDPGLDLLVTLDTEKVLRCLVNFLSNAIKFTPENGTIRVGAYESQRAGLKGVVLSVRDSGVGIPKDDLERIFDKFYQVDNTATRKANGTGLGLSIVKEIVQAHGGDVWAESEEGRGSNFQIFIPAINGPGTPAP